MSSPAPHPPQKTVVLGPGPRAAALEPLVAALAGEAAYRIETLGAALDLLERPDVVLVLDAGRLEPEDLGLLHALAQRGRQWSLELFGGDPSASVVRRLSREGAVRWTPWPVDTETLGRWCASSPAAGLAPTSPTDAAPAGHRAPAVAPTDPTLAEIERILGTPGAAARPAARESGPEPRPQPHQRPTVAVPPVREEDDLEDIPDDFDAAPPEAFMAPLDAEELEALQGSPLEPFEPPPPATEAPTPEPVSTLPLAALPAWYRDQVADLADMAQRLDLGLRRTLEAGGMEETDAALESLSHDVLRLGQFTRTLGYLAAPPGANGATLDLSGLAADFLSTLASEDEAGPRFLFRGEPETRVRADKGLLVLVLDALLTVTSLVAGQGGEVRVAVERGEDQAHLTIQFPAGVLTDLEPARWMEPYALHRRLPGVGPNAVAAAASILAGQGGGLELVADGSQRTFQLHLPLA